MKNLLKPSINVIEKIFKHCIEMGSVFEVILRKIELKNIFKLVGFIFSMLTFKFFTLKKYFFQTNFNCSDT